MQSRPAAALITLVTAANTAGCYSTWDIRPDSLIYLDGFGVPKPPPQPQIVEKQVASLPGRTVRVVVPPKEEPERTWQVVATNGESVEFTKDTKLDFRTRDGMPASAKFSLIRVERGMFTGVQARTGRVMNVDMKQLAFVQATNSAPEKNALWIIATVAAGGTLLYLGGKSFGSF